LSKLKYSLPYPIGKQNKGFQLVGKQNKGFQLVGKQNKGFQLVGKQNKGFVKPLLRSQG
jgi:hypothetical protein